MTYEEFIAYLRKRAHEDLGYDIEMIEFYHEGYISSDPKMLEWIRDSNLRYVGEESDALLTDFLVLKEKADADITNIQRIAVKQIYEGIKHGGEETGFEQIKTVKKRLENGNINLSAIHDRVSDEYEKIRNTLILRPLNFDNHERELTGCVYRRNGDVALVLYQLLGDSEYTLTSSKIGMSELKRWGMQDKTDAVLQSALENTAKLFPACVYDKRIQKEADLLAGDFSRNDITILGHQILMTTFKTTNGALSLFYPGVVEKLMKIMGGAFTAVFMNINDVMIFDYDAPLAHEYAKTAGASSPLGEMLSDKCYHCDENGIHVME